MAHESDITLPQLIIAFVKRKGYDPSSEPPAYLDQLYPTLVLRPRCGGGTFNIYMWNEYIRYLWKQDCKNLSIFSHHWIEKLGEEIDNWEVFWEKGKDMSKEFEKRLREVLKNFDLEIAESLSDEIHEFEEGGGQISDATDQLWLELSERISNFYHKKKSSMSSTSSLK